MVRVRSCNNKIRFPTNKKIWSCNTKKTYRNSATPPLSSALANLCWPGRDAVPTSSSSGISNRCLRRPLALLFFFLPSSRLSLVLLLDMVGAWVGSVVCACVCVWMRREGRQEEFVRRVGEGREELERCVMVRFHLNVHV